MRDYLKSSYRLTQAGGTLTVTALAEARRVAPASATAMIKKLVALGLMDHRHYGEVTLTPEGTRQALLAIRRHRLLECFLVRMLGFGLDEVHDESHSLEPAISERLEERIDQALGHPKRCPHGDPIPDVNGRMDHDPGFPLIQLEENVEATVLRVPGSKRDLLRHLIELGVEPEKPICVVKREPFGGSLHLRLGRRVVLLSQEAASTIYVAREAG
jgi:DtxR family Mn-dependent transcriptional regulator